MLACIACSKLQGDDLVSQQEEMDSCTTTPNTKRNQAIKSLTCQLKDMALKASGAYCNPCTTQSRLGISVESDADSDRFGWSYRRTGSSSSATARTWGKEMEARLKGMSSSSGEATPKSLSGRQVDTVVFVEENEPREWVVQVEPGVLITFVSLPHGGNDLKRIRFSREMFNKWQAKRWWLENYDRVMELYNVQRFNRQAFPLPTPPRSEDESESESLNPHLLETNLQESHESEIPISEVPSKKSEFIFLIINILLELVSVVFDHLSSVYKHQYVFLAMVTSFVATIICIMELSYRAGKERVVLRWESKLPWFYHPSPNHRRFGTVLEMTGLIFAILQTISSTVAYILYLTHVKYTFNASLLPLVLAMSLFCSKFMQKPNSEEPSKILDNTELTEIHVKTS